MGLFKLIPMGALALGSVVNAASQFDVFDYVNPLIGTVNGGKPI
jgi:hypothetical protein